LAGLRSGAQEADHGCKNFTKDRRGQESRAEEI
jgi:hypothetical protein